MFLKRLNRFANVYVEDLVIYIDQNSKPNAFLEYQICCWEIRGLSKYLNTSRQQAHSWSETKTCADDFWPLLVFKMRTEAQNDSKFAPNRIVNSSEVRKWSAKGLLCRPSSRTTLALSQISVLVAQDFQVATRCRVNKRLTGLFQSTTCCLYLLEILVNSIFLSYMFTLCLRQVGPVFYPEGLTSILFTPPLPLEKQAATSQYVFCTLLVKTWLSGYFFFSSDNWLRSDLAGIAGSAEKW